MDRKSEIIKIFSKTVREILGKAALSFEKLQEIRLRASNPLMIVYGGEEFFLTEDGKRTKEGGQAFCVDKEEIRETMEYIAGYSLYAFEEELKQGFLTIQGGHRVGVAGRTVLEGEKVKSLKYISFINVRLSHQILGCADRVLPFVETGEGVYHTLIISPPRCGKTTLLRDMIRQISNGRGGMKGQIVGVVDERSEIGGAYLGIPQNDLGIRTDVLDCCPKAEGMLMLLRSMSPQVIAVDEIGADEDVHAIEYVIHCGCKLLATVHGSSIEDIRRRPLFDRLMKEKIFERYIVLENKDSIGEIAGVYDAHGRCLQGEEVRRC